MGVLGHIVMLAMSFLATIFVFAVGLFALVIVFLFVTDIG